MPESERRAGGLATRISVAMRLLLVLGVTLVFLEAQRDGSVLHPVLGITSPIPWILLVLTELSVGKWFKWTLEEKLPLDRQRELPGCGFSIFNATGLVDLALDPEVRADTELRRQANRYLICTFAPLVLLILAMLMRQGD